MYKIWSLKDIEEIFKRRFLMQYQGAELFTRDKKSYFFNLLQEDNCEYFFNELDKILKANK
jgi:6-pyruvoyl-tetrahydropterin synthase